MSESYEATFRWPHVGASDVIVTGTFDGRQWSCSHHLTKTPSGFFHGAFSVPWGDTIQYKYIVDGRWTTTDDQPTELDPMGNLNNVLRAPARSPPPRSVSPSPALPSAETPASKVNGFVETARLAVVGMVEAMAPGTTATPVETPVVETFEPISKLTPAPEEPVAAPAPERGASASETLSEAILPSSPAPVASEVPIPVLPLSTEAPIETVGLPSADVSESRPLETTIVEGSATLENAVETAPTPAIIPLAVEPTTADGSKPLKTTIVEGSATAETVTVPAPAAEPENSPPTHEPALANGSAAEKPTTNGVAHAVDSAPAANNTAPAPSAPATPAKSAKSSTTPPGSPATTPGKEKRMRFPSLSSRSLHARSRSSVETAGELGETNGNGHAKEGSSAKGSLASRLGGTERVKRRTSLFGRLKDVFHHPKPEAT
ncbi:hypothetical protein BC628DRAFT_1337367 [Trametes gibbosa]|nr:hypothetical protein BC628DRAFT_1337367 [Trametes gibbosa]